MSTKKTAKRRPGRPSAEKRPGELKVHIWLYLTPEEKKKLHSLSNKERRERLMQ